MLKPRVTLALVSAGIAATGITAAATSHASTPSVSTTQAVATFHRGLLGISDFVQRTGAIEVRGRYTNLIPGNSYYTVIYGNNNCDPAQAFPVGPFTADANGNAAIDTTMQTAIPVSGTMSMSVRRAATMYDVKANGVSYKLPAVVAVAGTPSIGLIECDSSPRVISASAH